MLTIPRPALVASAWALVLVVTSGGAIAFLALRIARTGDLYLSFLVVNLVLAWAPLFFALGIVAFERLRTPRWLLLLPASGWLAFLPNAPYIWTDLIHLGNHGRPLFVADFVIIASFAVAGLLAGYASLFLVHISFERAFGPKTGWALVAVVLPIVSLGIYIGRVLRWNSWEAIHRLDDFLDLAAMRLADPLGNPGLLAACALMTACLATGYAIVFALTRTALGPPTHQKT